MNVSPEIDAAQPDTQPAKPWDETIVELLSELSDAQSELLEVLTAKRQVIAAGQLDALTQFDARERALSDRLTACLARRRELLSAAAASGLPHGSMKELAAAVPVGSRKDLSQEFRDREAQSRMLSHQCLTNWVLSQQWLLHLGQCLEIIATGGRIKPTYSKEEAAHARGGMVDHAA